MTFIKILSSTLILCFSYYGNAQDMQFTQFNATPLYLNPGFTGSTVEHRFISNYRNQWAAVPGQFNNLLFSYDYNLAEFNSGIGFLFGREQAGTSRLTVTQIGGLYAYHFQLNKKIHVQPGLKFNYIFNSIDVKDLVFNDQLYTGGTTIESFFYESSSYLDIAAGVILYNEKFWGGLSFNHINQPNQSFTNNESPLYLKFSTHGGYKFKLDDGNKSNAAKYFNVVFQYKAQHKFDQLDLGLYYTQEPFIFGLWYRGLPLIKSYEGILNNDAVAIILGYTLADYNLSFGYSYDATISRLAANSAGSHEISIIYEVASKNKKKLRRKFFAPCAKF